MKKTFALFFGILIIISLSIFVSAEDNATVTPEEFGAVGDGITDDTLAVKNAILTGKTVSGKDGSVYNIDVMEIRGRDTYRIENCDFYIESRDDWSCIIDFIYSVDVHFENCNFKTENDRIPCSTIGYYMSDIESKNASNVCFIRTRNLSKYVYNMSIKNCTFENSGMDIITKCSDNDMISGQIDMEGCRSVNSVISVTLSNAEVYNIKGCYFYEHRAGNKFAHAIYFGFGHGSTCNVTDTYVDFCSAGGIHCYHATNYTLNMENVTMVNTTGGEYGAVYMSANGSKSNINNCRFFNPSGFLYYTTQVDDESTRHVVSNSYIDCKYLNSYSNDKPKNANINFDSCDINIGVRGIYGYNNTVKNCNIYQLGSSNGNIFNVTKTDIVNNYIQIDTSREHSLRFNGNCNIKDNVIVFGGQSSPKHVMYSTGENNIISNNKFYSWINSHNLTGGTSENNSFFDIPGSTILQTGRFFKGSLAKGTTAVVFGRTADYIEIVKNIEPVAVDLTGSGAIKLYTVENCTGTEKTAYILSDEKIFLNPSTNKMFLSVPSLEKVVFDNVDFSIIKYYKNMWNGLCSLNQVYTEEQTPVFDAVSDFLVSQKPSFPFHRLHKVVATDATCMRNGNYTYYHCFDCQKTFSDSLANAEIPKDSAIIPAFGHLDENGDGACDRCGVIISFVCSCRCHNDNFRFLWKLFRYLCKLFGIRHYKFCECGVVHY